MMTRRLTVILAAGVVGFSSLRDRDEVATLLDIPQSLVNRYGKLQEQQRGFALRQQRSR